MAVEYTKYQTPTGKTKWKYYDFLGTNPKDGTKEQLRKQGFNSKAAAKVVYERELTDYLTGKTSNSGRIRFKDLYENHYLDFYRNTGVGGSTIQMFKSSIERHVLPEIGNYFVKEITISDFQKLLKSVQASRKDYRKIIRYVIKMMDYAVQEGYAKDNPAAKVIINKSKVVYKKQRPEKNFYTSLQLMQFLDFMKEHANFYQYAFFRLLAFSGLRRGEAFALQPKDINYINKSIEISKTLTVNEEGKTILSHYTKTGNSETEKTSRIFLDDYTFEVLVKMVKTTNVKMTGHKYVEIHNAPFIFTSPVSRSFYHKDAANDWMRRFWKRHQKELEKLGLHEITPHGFRHSQASLLRELGVDVKDAQHRLRHSNYQTTMDLYTHLEENSEIRTLDALNTFSNGFTTLVTTLENK